MMFRDIPAWFIVFFVFCFIVGIIITILQAAVMIKFITSGVN